MAYTPKPRTPRTPTKKEPSAAATWTKAFPKKGRASREATRNTPSGATKSSIKPAKMPTRKLNPLDAAIMRGKPLKSKNKNPGRYLDK